MFAEHASALAGLGCLVMVKPANGLACDVERLN